MSKGFWVSKWTVLIYSGQGSVTDYCRQNNEYLVSIKGGN